MPHRIGIAIVCLHIGAVIYLPLGGFGMWSLLDKGSQAQFGVGATPPRRPM